MKFISIGEGPFRGFDALHQLEVDQEAMALYDHIREYALTHGMLLVGLDLLRSAGHVPSASVEMSIQGQYRGGPVAYQDESRTSWNDVKSQAMLDLYNDQRREMLCRVREWIYQKAEGNRKTVLEFADNFETESETA